MSSACTQHSNARSTRASRRDRDDGPYGTGSSAAPDPADDTARTSACAWSRHGARTHRSSPSRARARQSTSVRSTGPCGGRPARTGSTGSPRPRAAATRPSTANRWPMTPVTSVRRSGRRPSSNHPSRTGARHSSRPMSRSSASSRAVSASYGPAQQGTGTRAGRRTRQFSSTRDRSAGSRSRSRSPCSRPTASRSRSASSAQGRTGPGAPRRRRSPRPSTQPAPTPRGASGASRAAGPAPAAGRAAGPGRPPGRPPRARAPVSAGLGPGARPGPGAAAATAVRTPRHSGGPQGPGAAPSGGRVRAVASSWSPSRSRRRASSSVTPRCAAVCR